MSELATTEPAGKQILMSMSVSKGVVPRTVQEAIELGRMFYASGMFKNLTQAAEATAKIVIGAEFGMGPAASIMNIHLVQGRPQLAGVMIAGLIKKHPAYDYRVNESTAEAVEIEFYQDGESLGTERFTIEDAKRQGTQNTAKYPKNMLWNRAMSNGAKMFCADVFGGISVYTEGELIPDAEQVAAPSNGADAVRARIAAGDPNVIDAAYSVEDPPHAEEVADEFAEELQEGLPL